MITLPLKHGLEAYVDNDDAELIAGYNWYAMKMRNTWYVRATIPNSGGKKIYLHRLIMGEPEGIMIDHIDRNGLNCQKDNMREATNSENQKNRESSGGSSQFKGVYKGKGTEWTMEINTSGPKGVLTITGFRTEEGAAKRYDKLAKKYHGEFVRLNFPEEE